MVPVLHQSMAQPLVITLLASASGAIMQSYQISGGLHMAYPYCYRFVNQLLNHVVITGYVRHDARRDRVWLDPYRGQPTMGSVWVRIDRDSDDHRRCHHIPSEGNMHTLFCHIRACPENGFFLDGFAWSGAGVIYLNDRLEPLARESNMAKIAALVTAIEPGRKPRLWVRQHRSLDKVFPLDIAPGLQRRFARIAVGDLLFFEGRIVRTDTEYGQSFLVTKIRNVVPSNVLGPIERVMPSLSARP
jgi:hypothetical protein